MLKPLLDGLNAIYGPVMFLAAIIVAGFMAKSSLGKSTSDAQASAIAALKEEMEVLKRRIDNLKEENKRQERVMRTICDVLEKRGITITIDGEMINIEGLEHKRSATIVRIQNEEEEK